MKVASLFSGIGGFELGLSRASGAFEPVLFCDNLPTAQEVLRHRFPGVDIAPDVCDLKDLPADTNLVTAGFPCQDLSQAGKTAGLNGARSGLIGQVFRLLTNRKRAGRPIPWVVIENVPFMLQLNGGSAMRAIADELERLGYLWAYRVVDSRSFGLPQRRERVFLVASCEGDPSTVLFADDTPVPRPETDLRRFAHGFYWTEGKGGLGWAVDSVPTLKNGSSVGIASQPAVLLPDGRVVKPGIRAAEKLQGFPEDWTLPAEGVGRPNLRWSLVGNAVSTPVPKWIGSRILSPGRALDLELSPFPDKSKAPNAGLFNGERRFSVKASKDPLGIYGPSLLDVIGADHTPLSIRATAGFLARTRQARLRFEPGFISAVEKHLETMTRLES